MLIIHIRNYLAPYQCNIGKKIKFVFYSAALFSVIFFQPVSAQTENINTLPPPPPQLPAPPTESNVLSNTPEYVIIRSNNQITFSSETAASVSKILVKEGSRFLKDDILLELDCRIQQAELSKAMAQQKASNLAEVSAHKLKKYDSISEFELVKASADSKIADAEVSKLKAIVEKCTIKAPFNGAVAEIMVHDYETVKQGDPLLKIISTDNLEFDIQVPSGWLAWLHVGSVVNVHINEINKTVPATITRINPLIEPISQTVKIIAIISTPDSSLLPGMSGQASFPDNPNNKNQKGSG
jgi:membrane fusion protein (multidrug efflux system)